MNHNLKSAGWYYEDTDYNSKTDGTDLRKIKVKCPNCGRNFAAILSKYTKPIRHFSIDQDGELSAVELKSYCTKCKEKFTFKLDCS